MKKILVVLTNTVKYGKKNAATGLWLGEATEFVDEVQKQGFAVDYVSPQGGFVPLDPRSLKSVDDASFAIYEQRQFQDKALGNSLKPSEVNAADYCGIYYTGGHGVMWDFPNHSALERISLQIYQNNGYVMSVCHGIAGLLFIKDINGEYFVKDKKITGFTTTEEQLSGKSSVVPFYNEKVAEEHGAEFVKARAFKSFSIQDGRIITGQNPYSA
ncbi:MAG: type 1 glutamine amidotransferase domain-containing protein, partial [Tetragenococcus koreensis]|nr:type 1 glutamine amidotransferase domain-containing protein [Tetragenococcus koreensis]MDN6501971.1 type 1 glutamine amidotransferase domain-containing protein [Tetragenococcus koreensis]